MNLEKRFQEMKKEADEVILNSKSFEISTKQNFKDDGLYGCGIHGFDYGGSEIAILSFDSKTKTVTTISERGSVKEGVHLNFLYSELLFSLADYIVVCELNIEK